MDFIENFDNKTVEIIKNIALFARDENVSVYFVGGLVRDVLLNKKINDIDMVIQGSAIDFCQKLEKKYENYQIKSIHPDFNTAKMILEDIEIDFASTRQEEYPYSGCLPIVKNVGCSLKEDVLRRDFTINSIAASIQLDEKNNLVFDIIDYTGGIKDLERKKLRLLYEKSYIDDPTRILRCLDFRLRFGFCADKKTKILQKQYLINPNREHLSFARVDMVLEKIFSNPKISQNALKIIRNEKIYRIFLESINKDKSLTKNINEAIQFFEIKNPELIYQEAMKYSVKEKIEYEYKNLKFNSNYDVYCYFKNFSVEKLAIYYVITHDKRIKKYFKKLKDIKTEIKGKDLLQLGYLEGREIGEILNAILKEKINKNYPKTIEEELSWIKERFRKK